MTQVSLDALTFRYPGVEQPVFADLNLEIASGEAHALLGASGAGKTTLLNLLSGILSPSEGVICFDGKDVSRLSGRERSVAQVFQFPVLYESLSVADNLAFPLKTGGLARAAIAERVALICAELQIEDLTALKPRALNTFQKQLVAVGKALVRADVALVLLDEPLTAVEPRIKWRLRQTLRRAQADLGITTIYVTHDQTEALTFADRVSVLGSDGILQTDTPQNVYDQPAHEFVGHFVGSPGMNFLPAATLGIDEGERIGFRPEWATLDDAGPVRGAVASLRIEGTQAGIPTGLVRLSTEFGELAVRGTLSRNGRETLTPGMQIGVRVHRYVSFAAQKKVGAGVIA